MRKFSGILLAACIGALGCSSKPRDRRSLTPAHAAALADSVRAFMAQLSAGVSRQGPFAWRQYFSDSASFFMASERRLVFASGAAAATAIQDLTHLIRRIHLRWGDSVRVDPLVAGLAAVGAADQELRADTAGHQVDGSGYFTGLAEHRATGWQFRDAHWSVVAPPSAVR